MDTFLVATWLLVNLNRAAAGGNVAPPFAFRQKVVADELGGDHHRRHRGGGLGGGAARQRHREPLVVALPRVAARGVADNAPGQDFSDVGSLIWTFAKAGKDRHTMRTLSGFSKTSQLAYPPHLGQLGSLPRDVQVVAF